MARKKTEPKKAAPVAKKVAPPAKNAAPPAKKAPPAAKRTSWLDKKAHPVIEQYARQLDSFTEAMADGVIEESELEAQEARLADLMKEVEPELDDALHEKVTRLLCELTAYDLMQMAHSIQESRPKTAFRG
jgi:chemotaxis protein histidine kinase CheA